MAALDEYELIMRLVNVKDFARPIWGEIDVDEPVFDKYSKYMDYCEEHFRDEPDTPITRIFDKLTFVTGSR